MKRDGSMQTPGKGMSFQRIYKSSIFGILCILLVMCIILTIATNKFLTSDNLFSVFRSFSFIAIMGIGELLVIITGGIDLSVGSTFAFAGVVSAISLVRWGMPITIALLIGAAVGIIIGMLNGVFITHLSLPPFIATLGTLSIARGLAYGITASAPIPVSEPAYKFIGQGYIGPIPFPVVLLLLLGVIFSIFLQKTVLGRRIYAIGGNEEAAHVSGIRVKNVKIIVYSLSGLMAGIAGMATTGRLGVAQSTAGLGYELDAIASVIIGGASVTGGVGTVMGVILGAAIMGVLRNGLVLLSVSAYWHQAIIGCVIILAVAFDQLRYRKSPK